MTEAFADTAHRVDFPTPARILHPARMHAEAEPEDTFTAEEESLADVARFSEWLADQLQGSAPHYTGGIFDFHAFEDSLERAELSKVEAYTLYPRADVCYAATQELKRRYLAAQQAIVQREAQAIAQGRAL